MKLLVGLGNPGEQYQATRHNFGFILLDYLIKNFGFEYQGKKHQGELFAGEIANQKIIAIKPQTYMNLSGSAVLSVSSFFKIPPKEIFVLHDDLDLALGRIKIKFGGSNGGHNGLKSTDQVIGPGYWRARLGIGRPQFPSGSISNYVLQKFTEEELNVVKKVSQAIVKNFPSLLAQGQFLSEKDEEINQQKFLNLFQQEMQKS